MFFYTLYIVLTKSADLIKKEWNFGPTRIIIAGILGILGYTLILIAFTFARVSCIVGLRQTSILFAVLLGSRLLREKHQVIRLTGALIIFTGGFLISTAH